MSEFHPILASDNIRNGFIDYITTAFHMSDSEYNTLLRHELNQEGYITKGPFLEVSGSYKTGKSIHTLIQEGKACERFNQLEEVEEADRELKLDRPLYLHQQLALEKANAGANLVVTTGTGSGKTECFLIPVIDALLREDEQGTLKDGVRAILIYPMNALANDQIKRMRKLLKGYRNITFGIYNGNTRYSEKDALRDYKKANGPSAVPLDNEMISREKMQATPPHILITNYSMLEYMMLRPNDDKVFSGAKLRYIILDEAHIYKGTTGMETAMLMRRLRARISTRDTVQYILTSATLGDKKDNESIIKFAERLCDVHFRGDDIIRSEDATPPMLARIEFPLGLFSELAKGDSPCEALFAKYNVADYAPGADKYEKYYELLLRSALFARFSSATKTPITVHDLQRKLNVFDGISLDQLIDFISVCTKAEKGKTSLIKAKYHFFVRTLEGAYITLNEPKQLFLQRKSQQHSDKGLQAVFEIAVCTDCGRIAIVGRENNGYLEQVARKTLINPADCDYFLLDDGTLGEDLLEEENEEESSEGTDENDFVICPRCSKISMKGDLRFGAICDCENTSYVPLKRARRTKSGNVKCSACGYGTLRAFYLGNDSATAVLGTELFEQLPDEVTINTQEKIQDSPAAAGVFAAMLAKRKPKKQTEKIERQFLCFSDSRSEAAFFANYMEKSYEEFLRRRAILQVANQLREDGTTSISFGAFADKLTRFFENRKTFSFWNPDGKESADELHQKSISNAWVALLNELFNTRRGTSLPSLGLLAFDYKRHHALMEPMSQVKEYNITEEEARALLNLLVMDAVYTGAIDTGGKIDLLDAEREYIFFNTGKHSLILRKNANSKEREHGWAARRRENGNYYPNTRIQRLVRALGIDEKSADEFLEGYWDAVFNPSGATFVLDASEFDIRLPGDSKLKFYRCQKCGRITPHNVKNQCSSIKCDGTLIEIDPDVYTKDNHYVGLYKSSQMQPLQIKEHTAQLSKNLQTRYQQAFVDKQINALSCSTTFEMGVDVGGLETVYMRNVPPSPANYVQRAGRAGRASHTAAFVLTFAKLSSHDFTFYQAPESIISGKIQAPVFELENEKVVIRHIYAVALSKFFAAHEDVYAGDDQSALLNEGGYEKLKDYLSSKPEDLKTLLFQSVPKGLYQRLEIPDYGWTEQLIGPDGTLEVAIQSYRNEIQELEKAIKQYKRADDLGSAASAARALKQLRASKEDRAVNPSIGKKSLISFLVRNNILPKYGFPVDTVELHLNSSTNADRTDSVQLVRDLQMAIAEYAPGAEVIADGKLYKSRYIRKLPGKDNASAWEIGWYCECPSCSEPNLIKKIHPIGTGEYCISCHSKIPRLLWKRTLEPRQGFTTEGKPIEAPLRKPERDYKTADYYVGDQERKKIDKLRFEVNDQTFELESTFNDSLAVVSYNGYQVCPVCGYASENGVPLEHRTPGGYICTNKNGASSSQEYRLSHTFKTFVAKITFHTVDAVDYPTMLSTMYALLEGLSRELGIERTDLKGCLHRVLWDGSNRPIFSILLYDAVAGGAGHVRRLVTKDAEVFQRVLKNAFALVHNCNCDPSCYHCLRNYYNSQQHDILDRRLAASFLEKWIGNCTAVPIEDENSSADAVLLTSAQDVLQYDNWKEFSETFGSADTVNWDAYEIDRSCYTFGELQLGQQTLTPFFVWPDQKVAVFETTDDDNTDALQEIGWKCYYTNVDPSILYNALSL